MKDLAELLAGLVILGGLFTLVFWTAHIVVNDSPEEIAEETPTLSMKEECEESGGVYSDIGLGVCGFSIELTKEKELRIATEEACKKAGGEPKHEFYFNSVFTRCENEKLGKIFETYRIKEKISTTTLDVSEPIIYSSARFSTEFIETPASKACSPYINNLAKDVPIRCLEYIKRFNY